MEDLKEHNPFLRNIDLKRFYEIPVGAIFHRIEDGLEWRKIAETPLHSLLSQEQRTLALPITVNAQREPLPASPGRTDFAFVYESELLVMRDKSKEKQAQTQ